MAATAQSRDRKTELLLVLSEMALKQATSPVSLRQFSIAAGVSEPTLRHHFTDRQGLVIAILGHLAGYAREFIARTAEPGDTLEASVRGYLDLAKEGVGNDLFARAHAFALVESMHDPVVAQAYLSLIIEPSLGAIEARLAPSLDPDGGQPDMVRDTAFFLYAPVLVAVLHQKLLRGEDTRPLDFEVFFTRLTGLLNSGAGSGSSSYSDSCSDSGGT